MRSLLDAGLIVTNPFGTPGYGVFGKHAGVDLRASVGTPFYAPWPGHVYEYYIGSGGNVILGVEMEGKWWRFLHLQNAVRQHGSFQAGELLGHTGNSGNVAAHLHVDVRKPGSIWNASFSNYYDPMPLLKQAENEMIATPDEAQKVYRVLRINGNATQGELDNTVGKRTYKEFMNSALAEVSIRDAGIQSKDRTIDQFKNELTIARGQLADKDKIIAALGDELSLAKGSLTSIAKEMPTVTTTTNAPPPKPKPTLLHRLILRFIDTKKQA